MSLAKAQTQVFFSLNNGRTNYRSLFISHTRRFFLPSIDYRTYRLHIYRQWKRNRKVHKFFFKKVKEKDSSITRDRFYFYGLYNTRFRLWKTGINNYVFRKIVKIIINFKYVRASVATLSNVPNVKYLTYLTHKTRKRNFIRCSKSQKLCHIATVLSHATMAKWDIIILLHFSLSSSTDISLSVNSILFLLSLSLSISFLSSLLKKVAQDHSQKSFRWSR